MLAHLGDKHVPFCLCIVGLSNKLGSFSTILRWILSEICAQKSMLFIFNNVSCTGLFLLVELGLRSVARW